MPKLTTIPAATPVQLWPVEKAPSAQLMADIRTGIRRLDALGATGHADYWVQELHRIDGHPIERRWTAGALRLIERDVIQAELETGA
jgi:hypothetical protein